MKKWISFLLVAVLCMGLFAGCNNTTASTTGSVPPASSVSGDTSEANPYAEHLKIQIEVPDMPDVVGTGDRITEYLMDKFNVEFEFIAPSYGEQMEKLRMIMASGKIPDVVQTWGTGDGDHKKWVEDGLLLDITDYLDDYPNVKAVTDVPGYQIWKAEGDRWYGIPKYYASMYPWGFQIRTDWLEELGLEMPRTTEDLYNVLKAFVENDPDGQKNIGLTANFDFFIYEFLVPAFTGIAGWGEYEGEYVSSNVHPGYKDYLKYMNKLYTEGLLDPDFMLNQDGHGVEKFLAGRAGVVSYNIDSISLQRKQRARRGEALQ